MPQRFISRLFATLSVGLLLAAPTRGVFAADTAAARGLSMSVFDTRPAPFEEKLGPNAPAAGEVLRTLVVEDRVGAARTSELVRVPLFFHAGECDAPDAVAIYDAADAKRERPLVTQADDVRRDPGGAGVSRMHLYFEADLKPWERKRFVVAKGKAGTTAAGAKVVEAGEVVTLSGEQLSVTFQAKGPRAGAITKIETSLGKVALGEQGLAPRLTLQRQTSEKGLKVTRATPVSYDAPDALEVRDLRYAAGPLFAKLMVTVGPKGVPDNAEYTYIVPRNAPELIQSQRLFPTDYDDLDVVGAKDNVLLAGKLKLGDVGQHVMQISAGLRRLTRSTQPHKNDALVSASAGLSVFAVPYVQTGMTGVSLGEAGVAFNGPRDFTRTEGGNSHTLRQFWGQVRYVFTKATTQDALWEVGRSRFQPLTAVVDEPGVTHDDLHALNAEIVKAFYDIKYWSRGWAADAAMLHLKRDRAALEKLLEKRPGEKELVADYFLPAWAKAGEKEPVPAKGQKRDVGRLDPYSITYGMASAPCVSKWLVPNERIDRQCLAIAKAQRQVNGRIDSQNFAYIECFFSALNMPAGQFMMGIYAGDKYGDPELAQYWRDVARMAPVLSIYGHGQRTYTAKISDGNTDLLYEALSDLYLRSNELLNNEDLWLHPAVYGRYFDAVDVTSDFYQRDRKADDGGHRAWWRANMFRAQAHDHRWESWDAAPVVGLFAHADDNGMVGLTDACYFAKSLVGRRMNWSELMTFFLTDVNLSHGLEKYQPQTEAPALPADVKVSQVGGKNVVTWQAAVGATGYRVYRADKMGGPWTFVNSPYLPEPRALVTETKYIDAEGKAGQVYFVTAIDANRRESRWFPDEPTPRAGKDAGK